MNAEDFYEQFKEALKFLGVPWGEKEKVTVTIFDKSIRFAYLNKECGFEL
jgi:hypothetical protein